MFVVVFSLVIFSTKNPSKSTSKNTIYTLGVDVVVAILNHFAMPLAKINTCGKISSVDPSLILLQKTKKSGFVCVNELNIDLFVMEVIVIQKFKTRELMEKLNCLSHSLIIEVNK